MYVSLELILKLKFDQSNLPRPEVTHLGPNPNQFEPNHKSSPFAPNYIRCESLKYNVNFSYFSNFVIYLEFQLGYAPREWDLMG